MYERGSMNHGRKRSWTVLAAVVLVLASLLGGTALAANVKGKLLTGAYKPAPGPRPVRPAYNWEVENGARPVEKDRLDAQRELAVVLLGKSEKKGDDIVEVQFSGGGLLPATVAVRQGTTLRVRNQDEVAHELYAVGSKELTPEATSPKAIRPVNLSEAGNWPLRDRLVTHVHGHLWVLPDLVAVATIDANRDFVFDGVAPGKYTLKVFHGGKELMSKPLEVTDTAEVTLDPITLTSAATSSPAK
jgi:plastocyanin